MINLKVSVIIAGIAFILSFLIGIISSVSMPMLLVRPLILAAVFFILSAIIYFLARNFLPELLDMDNAGNASGILPGSRINITEGDISDSIGGYPDAVTPELQGVSTSLSSKQVFMGAQADDSDEGLGNISDIIGINGVSGGQEGSSIGMDHNAQDGYTVKNWEDRSEHDFAKEFGGRTSQPEAVGGKASSGHKTPVSTDVLPDLDSMAGAFLPSAANAEQDSADYSIAAASKKQHSGAKSSGWSGDFNAKDMAAGLRTILRKDKEG